MCQSAPRHPVLHETNNHPTNTEWVKVNPKRHETSNKDNKKKSNSRENHQLIIINKSFRNLGSGQY
jgi:hypothetical protein